MVYIDSRVNFLSATEITAGISFALSDEQRALRALAREFAAKDIRPLRNPLPQGLAIVDVDIVGHQQRLREYVCPRQDQRGIL